MMKSMRALLRMREDRSKERPANNDRGRVTMFKGGGFGEDARQREDIKVNRVPVSPRTPVESK
jgi:hypothetical protein